MGYHEAPITCPIFMSTYIFCFVVNSLTPSGPKALRSYTTSTQEAAVYSLCRNAQVQVACGDHSITHAHTGLVV